MIYRRQVNNRINIIITIAVVIWLYFVFTETEPHVNAYGSEEPENSYIGPITIFFFIFMALIFFLRNKYLNFSSYWRYNEDNRLVAYVILGLHMIRMERDDSRSQVQYLRMTLSKRFQNNHFNEIIKDYWKEVADSREVLNWLAMHGSNEEAIEIFDFMVDLAYYNNHVNRNEMSFLIQVGAYLNIDKNTVKSILSIREQQRRKREEQRRESTRQTIRKGKNYYKNKYLRVLGLSNESDFEAVRKAYRKLARELHPDRFARKSNEDQQAAHERFTEINIAHDKLKEMMVG
jgi:DnaJ-domain-containing protein 1